MDDKFKTSADILSLTEGQNSAGPGAGPYLYGDESAPTGVPTRVAMSQENQLKTTQQIRGEFSLPEGSGK